MFADYHVHTEYNDDSVYPMEDVLQEIKTYKNYFELTCYFWMFNYCLFSNNLFDQSRCV